jgi:hypothetical protein
MAVMLSSGCDRARCVPDTWPWSVAACLRFSLLNSEPVTYTSLLQCKLVPGFRP